jgi:hypothetical protein
MHQSQCPKAHLQLYGEGDYVRGSVREKLKKKEKRKVVWRGLCKRERKREIRQGKGE